MHSFAAEVTELEGTMLALLSLITLIVATSLAAAAAVALNWILLHTALRLMRTSVRATAARPVPVRRELVYGTVRLARALTPRGPQA